MSHPPFTRPGTDNPATLWTFVGVSASRVKTAGPGAVKGSASIRVWKEAWCSQRKENPQDTRTGRKTRFFWDASVGRCRCSGGRILILHLAVGAKVTTFASLPPPSLDS